MSSSTGRFATVASLALVAVFAFALATHAGPAVSAPTPLTETTVAPMTPMTPPATACPADGLAAELGLPGLADPAAVTPHCCSQGEISACRDGCKAQGPGCKGQIGCTAGECVCTCNCP
ncbi:MAG: hypothetical protein KDD11_16960 [Acidobacteria bacterium]|nr:hypothetical protein [Acidobacteriota bacterium]